MGLMLAERQRQRYHKPMLVDLMAGPYHPPDPDVPELKRFPPLEHYLLLNMWYSYTRRYNEIPQGKLWHMTSPEQILGFVHPFTPSPNDRTNLTNNPSAMERLIRKDKLPKKKIPVDSPLLRVEIAIPDPTYLGEARVTKEGFDVKKRKFNFERVRLDFKTAKEVSQENYRRFDLVAPGEEPLFLGTKAIEVYKKLVELQIIAPIEQEIEAAENQLAGLIAPHLNGVAPVRLGTPKQSIDLSCLGPTAQGDSEVGRYQLSWLSGELRNTHREPMAIDIHRDSFGNVYISDTVREVSDTIAIRTGPGPHHFEETEEIPTLLFTRRNVLLDAISRLQESV